LFSSIVAIHGLDTNAGTWLAFEKPGDPNSSPVHWLGDEHMLPSVIKNARIYTYDWNANTKKDASADNLRGHANLLLDELSRRWRKAGLAPAIPYC
jgi:hypothetical protein